MVKHTATSVVTIERFIIEQEKMHPEATGELSGILYDMALAAKMIANKVRSAGLADILGSAEQENVQGEMQQKLDVFANDTIIKAVESALTATHDNKQRVAATMREFYTYVADAGGAFRLVFESDLTSETAVRERLDRVTNSCADAIAHVIHDDTGLPAEESRLLAVSLVGMAQVSARFWLAENGSLPQHQATDLVASLAWRGIRGFPRSADPG